MSKFVEVSDDGSNPTRVWPTPVTDTFTPIHGLIVVLSLLGLFLVSRENYSLFHILAEVFSILVGVAMFMVAWNTRRMATNKYVLFLSVAYFFVAWLDLFHLLTYQGMRVFPNLTFDPSLQLWISARYLQSLSLLLAPIWFKRRFNPQVAALSFMIIVGLALVSIFIWPVFPTCFVENVGLTPFKKISEYIICLTLLAAGVLLYRNRAYFAPKVFRLLLWSIILTTGSELFFSLCVSPHGLANFVGHILKIMAFYLVYRGVVVTSLRDPMATLLKDLAQERTALLENRELLSTTLRAIDDAVMATDREGLITLMNPKAEELTGWTRDEAVGRPLSLVFKALDEKTGQPYQDTITQVVEHGQSVQLSDHAVLISKNGSHTAIDHSAGPMVGRDDFVQGVVLVFRDVTQDRLARAAVIESEFNYRDLYEKAPVPYFSVSAEQGAIIRCNQATLLLLGYDREVLSDLNVIDLFADSPGNKEKAQEVLESLKAGQATRDAELEMKHRDGRGIWVRLSVEPLYNAEGPVVEGRFMAMNVTQTRQIEQALRESEAKFRNIITSNADGILILTSDGRVRYANPAAETMFGRTAEQLVGKDMGLPMLDGANHCDPGHPGRR